MFTCFRFPCMLAVIVSVTFVNAQDPAVGGVSGSKLHVIYAADTSDPSIGNFIKVNVEPFERLIRESIREERLASFESLTGAECTAEKFKEKINGLAIQPADTLFVFYQGHGNYDPQAPPGSIEQGHFLSMSDRPFPRHKLMEQLLAKSPRLLIFLSDCCNVVGYLPEPQEYRFESRTREVAGWSNYEELLFCHRGIIDATASSRDEFSWFSGEEGGWFTTTYMTKVRSGIAGNPVDWNAVWPELTQETEDYFQILKAKYHGLNSDLDAQEHMRPLAYRFDVTREDPVDTPQGIQAFLYTVRVPVLSE